MAFPQQIILSISQMSLPQLRAYTTELQKENHLLKECIRESGQRILEPEAHRRPYAAKRSDGGSMRSQVTRHTVLA